MSYALTPELRVAASPELLSKGCVYVLDMEQIKSEVGDRWEKVKAGVWGHLHNLMRQKLASTDFYSEVSDMAVLVSMPSLSSDEAHICCLGIAHALHATMLGSCDPETLVIQRAMLLADGSIGASAVARPRNSPSPAIGSLRYESKHMTSNADFHHVFAPIWNAQKEAITTYRCTTLAGPIIDDGLAKNLRCKLELAMTVSRIRHAASLLSEGLAAGQRFMTWLPLSYELICSPASRLEIAATMRELSGDLRPLLVVEIKGLPYGVPQSRLSELVGSFKPFCRGVVAQLPPRIANYSAYFNTGLHGIGLSLSAENVWKTEMQSEMFKLGIAAGKQQIVSFVLDVPTAEILHAARSFGITLVSSPMIGPATRLPGSVRLLAAQTIAPQDVATSAA
jgi:hypothetical protein